MPSEVIITSDLVDSLIDSNYNVNYPDKIILDVKPQEYRIGTHYVTEPVGVIGQQIEGHFLNVVIRSSVKENNSEMLRRCRCTNPGHAYPPSGISQQSAYRQRDALRLCVRRYRCRNHHCSSIRIIFCAICRLSARKQQHHLEICSKQVKEEEAEDLKLKYGTAFF